jgi:hypothetical protein
LGVGLANFAREAMEFARMLRRLFVARQIGAKNDAIASAFAVIEDDDAANAMQLDRMVVVIAKAQSPLR